MDPVPLQSPLVYWGACVSGGRARLRITVAARAGAKGSTEKAARLPIIIAPEEKGGQEIRSTAVGLVDPKVPSVLTVEADVPPGRYRAFPASLPAAFHRFEVAPDGRPPIRIFCRHPKEGSHADFLGFFSRKGAPWTSLSTYHASPCCRRDFPKANSRTPNTRSLGILQALSRPLRLTPHGRPVTLRPGEFLIVDPDAMALIAQDAPFPMHFRHLLIEPAVWSDFLRALNLAERFPLFGFDPVAHPNDPLLDASLAHLAEAMRTPGEPGTEAYVRATLHQVVAHLVRKHPSRLGTAWRRRGEAPEKADRRLARATRYLKEHLAEPYDRSALARAACASRQVLQRLFHEHLHQSPTAYLQSLRIERAKKLLLDPDRTLREVAAAVGYRDVRGFRRVFKRLAQSPMRPARTRG